MKAERRPPRLFDSHCHIQDPAFDDDRELALSRASDAGVEAIVAVGADPESAARARSLACETPARRRPRVHYTAGLHPHDASRWSAEIAESILEHLDRGAVAVGETGLDFHYENSPQDVQREAFAAQLAIAKDRDLPVVIHSRDAEEETLEVLADSGIAPGRVVLHCFSGSRAMLEEGVARGYFVSFSGMVTFRSFPAADLALLVPEGRLLAETDAPYLAPVPHRGKRNEPAFVSRTVERLAEVRGKDFAAMAERTFENAVRFYGL